MAGPAASSMGIEDLAATMQAMFDEGSPAVLRGCGDVFSVPEVFGWIRDAHPPARSHTAAAKIRAVKQSWGLSPADTTDASVPTPGRGPEVYRSGALMLDPTPFLPTDAHPSFEAWVEAARSQLGPDFGLMAPGLECASWTAMDKLQALLAPTLRQTGCRSYRYNAFLGDYRRTPFGFHLDPHQECVFQFTLAGQRRASFWEGLTLGDEDASWIERTSGENPPQREPEVVLDVGPGDLVFWPATHAHGFESQGPSMGLSLVIDRTSPQSHAEVVAALELATLGGVAALPPVDASRTLSEEDRADRRSRFPLAYAKHNDTLIVAVCGRTFEWPELASHAAAMDLCDYLIAHPSSTVADIANACATESMPRADVCGVLSMLAGLGYFADAAAGA